MSTRNVKITGISGGGLVWLTIALVVLKALGYIDVAWVWVFAPLWLVVSFVVCVVVVVFVVVVVLAAMGLVVIGED